MHDSFIFLTTRPYWTYQSSLVDCLFCIVHEKRYYNEENLSKYGNLDDFFYNCTIVQLFSLYGYIGLFCEKGFFGLCIKRGSKIKIGTKTEDLKDFTNSGGHLGHHLEFRKIPNDAAKA